MKRADLEMKRALDEGAQYGRLRPLSAAANTLRVVYPEVNLTTFTTRSPKPWESDELSFGTPSTPYLTLHQFRQSQHSPVPSSSPDLDYKRVRRKKSSVQLGRLPFDSTSFRTTLTSSAPSRDPTSPPRALSSLLPPLPLTPVSRLGTKAPSLSSTVDTIQSTPTHTPISFGDPGRGQWRELEGLDLSEPLRTKRKFPLFKQAKRLPHHTLHGAGDGGGVWQIHAAVIDLGEVVSASGDLERARGERVGTEIVGESERGASTRGAARGTGLKPGSKKGRSVRFKGIENEIRGAKPHRLQSLNSQQEREASLSSSFSLSKFDFPEPPQRDLLGALDQHGEPGSPTSPATLHYRGISFDVVNPHDSLILGSSKIETPAEIDGLLDDYFDSRPDLSTMLPYDDITGEAPGSYQSSRAAGSGNGRSRVLYNDTDSARRRIMGITDENELSTSNETPYHESPLAHRNNRPPTPLFGVSNQARDERLAQLGLDEYNEAPPPRPLQIHRNLTEALHRGAATRPNEDHDGFENVELHAEPRPRGVSALSGDLQYTSGGPEQARPADEDPSESSHSVLSAPFQLTISDLSSAHPVNIDEVLAGVRSSSYYASANAAFDDREDDFHIYQDYEPPAAADDEQEDVADANATQNTVEGETTVGNILSHYNYPRPPLAPLGARNVMPEETHTSSSIEAGRADTGEDDDLLEMIQTSSCNPVTGGVAPLDGVEARSHRSAMTPGVFSPLSQEEAERHRPTAERMHMPEPVVHHFGPPIVPYEPPPRMRRPQQGPPMTRAPLPPTLSRDPRGLSMQSTSPHPTPIRGLRRPPIQQAPSPHTPRRAPTVTPPYYASAFDLPTSDRTYGNTSQLLQMTPQAGNHASTLRGATEPALPTAQSVANLYPPIQRSHRRHNAMTAPVAFVLDSDSEGEEEEEIQEKENTAPPTSTAEMGMGSGTGIGSTLTVPTAPQRSSSVYSQDVDDSTSTLASDSRANFGEPLTPMRGTATRPSQESYANTSRCDSDPHFIMPPVTPRVYDARGRLMEVASRPRPRQPDSGIPASLRNLSIGVRGAAKGKGKMSEIPEGKAVGAILSPPSQHITDISEIERLRERANNQPGVLGRLGRLFNLTSSKSTQSQKPTVAKTTQTQHKSTPTDRLSLLPYANSPARAGGLQFSDTVNTFTTSPRTPLHATEPFSLISPTPVTPPTNAYMRNAGTNTPRPYNAGTAPTPRPYRNPLGDTLVPSSGDIELQPIRKKQARRAAMDSQIGLLTLETAQSTTTSPLTNQQLMDAESRWTTAPNFSPAGPLATQYALHGGFEIQQRDGSTRRVNMLMPPGEARNLDMYAQRHQLSKTFFECCIWCPLSALLFGVGGLDWRARQLSGGAVAEMDPVLKRRALAVYLPLGVVIWAAFGIVVGLCVVLGT